MTEAGRRCVTRAQPANEGSGSLKQLPVLRRHLPEGGDDAVGVTRLFLCEHGHAQDALGNLPQRYGCELQVTFVLERAETLP